MSRLLRMVCLVVLGCGGQSQSNNSCHELSLAECRLADGCRPDMCAGCVCDLQFRGCLAVFETPTACPQLGCPSGSCCTRQLECGSQGSCTPPGTRPGCGACNIQPGDCTNDATCKTRDARLICEPIPCTCTDQRTCVPGCINDDDCSDGRRCDVDTARCKPIACTRDPQCPPDFRCNATACERMQCTNDLDCDGFCVLGSCFTGALGQCLPPSA